MTRHAWTAIVWLLLCAPAVAHATLPLELRWQAPAECPASDAVEAELGRLARVRAGFALELLSAEVTVTRAVGSYQAHMRTLHAGQTGVRTLDARDCTTLVRTVALVLALTFGEGVELQPTSPAASEARAATSAGTELAAAPAPPAREQEPAAQPAQADRSDQQAARGSQQPAPLSWRYALGAGAQFGLLGAVMASVAGQAELERSALQLALRLAGSFAPE
ncbi:MAG TPA: hypothetical protein VFZ61_04775, partial [Polyangiales bacterium]